MRPQPGNTIRPNDIDFGYCFARALMVHAANHTLHTCTLHSSNTVHSTPHPFRHTYTRTRTQAHVLIHTVVHAAQYARRASHTGLHISRDQPPGPFQITRTSLHVHTIHYAFLVAQKLLRSSSKLSICTSECPSIRKSNASHEIKANVYWE